MLSSKYEIDKHMYFDKKAHLTLERLRKGQIVGDILYLFFPNFQFRINKGFETVSLNNSLCFDSE